MVRNTFMLFFRDTLHFVRRFIMSNRMHFQFLNFYDDGFFCTSNISEGLSLVAIEWIPNSFILTIMTFFAHLILEKVHREQL